MISENIASFSTLFYAYSVHPENERVAFSLNKEREREPLYIPLARAVNTEECESGATVTGRAVRRVHAISLMYSLNVLTSLLIRAPPAPVTAARVRYADTLREERKGARSHVEQARRK